MDYAQDRITTLHNLADHIPQAPTDDAVVVVPIAERDVGSLAAERTLEALETVQPANLLVPLRAAGDQVGTVREWLSGLNLSVELLWCGGDRLAELIHDRGLDGTAGKGRDLWLALGIAASESPYIVCHDADRRTYSTSDVPRLLSPIDDGFEFIKGYYARVENNRLYGRLWRLLYVPLIRTLQETNDAPILDYLGAFRYGLAGEFALTAELARSLHVERRFGLEVGTLGDAFERAGFRGTAQVDLGRYEHDHRAVGGPAGLATMAADVATALFRVVESNGVQPMYDTIPSRYEAVAWGLIDQYAADAIHNGFTYDRTDELSQVEQYADAIEPPGPDDRLPPWSSAPLEPQEVRQAVRADLNAV